MAGKKRCKIYYPTPKVFEQAVIRLQGLYPNDLIRWKGGGREQVEQAIVAAQWAFQPKPCYARKLAAAAALFYEIIMLHPLTDGNKRLATLMLGAFLALNKLPLPRPGTVYPVALRVASREWGQEDVYHWLLRV